VKTPLSSILLVLFASFIGSFGAVFLKMGAAELGKSWKQIFNIKLATGVALFLGSSIPFIVALRNGELSVLYPMVSLGYVWTLFWSRLFFGERITLAKLGALGLILCGITLIGVGAR